MKTYDAAIIGGGLLGRLLAWRLAESGVSVILHEAASRAGEQSAAYVAAAMLAPSAEAVAATPLVTRLGYQSLPLWKDYLTRWPQKVFFQQQGSLMVWHGQDAALAESFRRHVQQAHPQQQVWQEWQAADIAAHEPQLAGRFRRGLLLPQEGQLDNRQTLLALAEAAEAAGAQCCFGHSVTPDEARAQAGIVIDCRGVAAKNDWNSAPGSRLRGVRGEVARVYAPEVRLTRPVRLLHPRYPLYICPKEAQVFVIGATQLESEDGGPVSVRGVLELFSALYAVCPAFGEARVLETASGLRPTLNHENPEIRWQPERRLLSLNGLFRHGFMIAPAVAEAALDLVQTALNGAALPESADGMPVVYQ